MVKPHTLHKNLVLLKITKANATRIWSNHRPCDLIRLGFGIPLSKQYSPLTSRLGLGMEIKDFREKLVFDICWSYTQNAARPSRADITTYSVREEYGSMAIAISCVQGLSFTLPQKNRSGMNSLGGLVLEPHDRGFTLRFKELLSSKTHKTE